MAAVVIFAIDQNEPRNNFEEIIKAKNCVILAFFLTNLDQVS